MTTEAAIQAELFEQSIRGALVTELRIPLPVADRIVDLMRADPHLAALIAAAGQRNRWAADTLRRTADDQAGRMCTPCRDLLHDLASQHEQETQPGPAPSVPGLFAELGRCGSPYDQAGPARGYDAAQEPASNARYGDDP